MIGINSKFSCSGEIRIKVNSPQGQVVSDSGWQSNMLSRYACEDGFTTLSTSASTRQVRVYESAISGSPIANKSTLAGTFTQAGNVVTSSGGVDFTDGTFLLGDNLKFAGGGRALIQSIDSATQVTVFESQTVTAEVAEHYITGRSYANGPTFGETYVGGIFTLGTATETENTSGVRERSSSITTAEATTNYTFDTVYIHDHVRIPLAAPIDVVLGNTITFEYRVRTTLDAATEQSITGSPVTGWPFQTNIETVSSNGSVLAVETTNDHLHLVGDSLTLQGVLPVVQTFTNITSNGTTWTLTKVGHGYLAAENVVLTSDDGGNYNGAFTIASVPDADTLTITNAASYADTTGTIRLEEPGTFYNQTFVIAAVPTSNTLELTTTLVAGTPAGEGGTLGVPNANYQLNLYGLDPWSVLTNATLAYAATEVETAPFPVYTEERVGGATTGFSSIPETGTNYTNTLATGFVRQIRYVTTTGGANEFRIKQLLHSYFGGNEILLTFDHPQRKPNSHELTIFFGFQHQQDLP